MWDEPDYKLVLNLFIQLRNVSDPEIYSSQEIEDHSDMWWDMHNMEYAMTQKALFGTWVEEDGWNDKEEEEAPGS